MRLALFAFLAVSAFAEPAASGAENATEWSDVVNGIRGRLVVIYHPDAGLAQNALVFLELENRSQLKEVFLGAGGPNLTWRIVDEVGVPVVFPPRNGNVIREIVDHVILPWDSTLRFRVATLPRKREAHYYISATFSSFPPPQRARAWSGTIWLPQVQVLQKK